MAAREVETIRNVGFLGEGGNGKTSLVEACLFTAGSTDRQGKVDQGNTILDGGGVRRPLSLDTRLLNSDIGTLLTVTGITFQNGSTVGEPDPDGGGLFLHTNFGSMTVQD